MDIIEQIEKWGNKNAIYYPFENAVCYPLHSRDFIQRGFCEICPTLCARDYKDPKCVIERSKMEDKMKAKQIGNVYDDNFGKSFAGNVWDKNYISPTLTSMQGGGRQPMIIDSNCNNIKCSEGEQIEYKMIVAMRGRNPENPSDRTSGIETEQRLEPQQEGICNTLTSVQKDNLVLESNETETITTKGEKIDVARTILNGYHRTNMTGFNADNGVCEKDSNCYRIRKLTPKECYRLMGFSDEDFEKAEKVNSNTQLYKQAGNSIVVDVLVEIFRNLFIETESIPLKGQMKLEDLI